MIVGNMLERLVQVIYASRDPNVDPLEAAAEFLREYEGHVVPKVRPQYVRMRLSDLESVGCTRSKMAKILGISERNVYQLLKRDGSTVQCTKSVEGDSF